jgi:hypothetical protein
MFFFQIRGELAFLQHNQIRLVITPKLAILKYLSFWQAKMLKIISKKELTEPALMH